MEHSDEGLSEEYIRAHNAYHAQTSLELKAYDLALRQRLRELEVERKKIVNTSADRDVPVMPRTEPTTLDKRCYTGTRDQQIWCLRKLLYPRTPAS